MQPLGCLRDTARITQHSQCSQMAKFKKHNQAPDFDPV
jgi:hypothetical protein